MAFGNVTLLAPAQGQAMPDTIDQPAIDVSWDAGTGPYTVDYIWDDDPTFANGNGNRQTAQNTGVVGTTDEAAPPAALADLTTTWYLKVTVTDTFDAASGSDTGSVVYFATNPLDRATLYLLANAGVGFTPTDDPAGGWGTGGNQGPDGDTQDFSRYLYLLANAGVGFKTTDEPVGGWGTGGNPDGGDGDEIERRRYLYLLENVDSTQPCPTIFSLSTPIAREGDAVVVRGQGLISGDDPTDAWSAEVRLYDSPDFGAAHTALTVVTWTAGDTEDTITVTVPAGVSSGYVAVVHTATPSCDGSNFVFLTVEQGVANPDAGWWIEAWTLDGQTRKIANVPVERASIQKVLNGVGSGQMTVPADYARLAEIIDPSPRSPTGVEDSKVQTLLKVFLDNRARHAFYAQQLDQELADPAESVAVVSGDDIKSYLGTGVLYPQDHPNARIRAGDWIYGATSNQVGNGDLEDGDELVSNGDFEQGDSQPWEGAGTIDVGNSADMQTVQTKQHSGQWSLRVGPDAAGDGVKQSLSVTPGDQIFLAGWVSDDLNSGQTAKAELYYVDDDDNEQSLDSDTVTLATTWKQLVLNAVVPADVTQVWVRVTNEAASGWAVFYIDDVSGVSSVEPWFAGGSTIQLDDSTVAEGEYSLKVTPTQIFGGAFQTIGVTPGQRLTISGVVSGTAGETITLRAVLDGVAVTDTVTLTGNPAFDVLSVTGTVGASETTIRFGFLTEETGGGDPFWVDAVSGVPGSAATSPGGIVLDFLAECQARGELSLVTADFTENITSDGEGWLESAVAITLRRGITFLDMLERLKAFGVDWDLTVDFTLRLFNRKGIDRTLLSDGVVLRTGTPAVTGGKLIRRIPRFDAVFAEGADGIWTTATDPDDIADLGRRATYLQATQATSPSTLQAAADNLLDDEQGRASSMRLDLSDVARTRPLTTFDEGDTVLVDAPDLHASAGEYPEGFRVVAITVDLEAENPAYSVDLNWMVLEEAAAQAAALRLLLERSKITSSSPGAGTLADSGGGSFIYQAPAAHTHVVSEVEGLAQGLQEGDAAGGDLAGTFPDPSVVKVRGKVVDAPTTKGDLWVYNGSKLVRLPVGTDDQVLTADAAEAAGVKWAAGGGGGVTDHGALTGLADDDHSQYLNVTRHDADDHSALQIVEAQITDLDHDDTDAIHDNVAGEFAAITEKASPVSADLLLIEDSEAANAKKRVQVGNLSGGVDHGGLAGLADDDHTQYLKADGTRQATYIDIGGLTGATAGVRYVGGTASGPPTSGTFAVGDVVVAENGGFYVCVTAGTPGTWVALGMAPGTNNLAIGADSGNPTGISGVNNVSLGARTLSAVTSGRDNTAIGEASLRFVTTGSRNTAVGWAAAGSVVSANDNVAIGWKALNLATSGSNVAVGRDALVALSTGPSNVAIGPFAGSGLTTPGFNVAVGASALTLDGGAGQVAIGSSALQNSQANHNIGIGYQSGQAISTGALNLAVGFQALKLPGGSNFPTTTGTRQTAIGYQTGQGSATQRSDTVALGYRAIFDADNATALGASAQANHTAAVALGANTITTAANQIQIGGRHIELTEITAPGNGAANSARLYAVDNGSGKTQLAVVFGSGAVQILATEP